MSKVTKEVTVDLSEVEVKLNECVDEFNKAIDNAFKKDSIDNECITLETVNTLDGKSYTFIKGEYNKHYICVKGVTVWLTEKEEQVHFNHNHIVSIVESIHQKDNVRFDIKSI